MSNLAVAVQRSAFQRKAVRGRCTHGKGGVRVDSCVCCICFTRQLILKTQSTDSTCAVAVLFSTRCVCCCGWLCKCRVLVGCSDTVPVKKMHKCLLHLPPVPPDHIQLITYLVIVSALVSASWRRLELGASRLVVRFRVSQTSSSTPATMCWSSTPTASGSGATM